MKREDRQLVKSFRLLLNRSNKRLKQRYKAGLSMLFASSLLSGFLILMVIEMQAYLSAPIKSVVLAIMFLTTALFILRVHRKQKNKLESSYLSPLISDLGDDGERVLSALELSQDTLQQDSRFLEAAIRQNLAGIDPDSFAKDLDQVAEKHPAYRLFQRSGLILLVVVLVGFVMAFTHVEALTRTAFFWNSYEKPNPFDYVISPGSITMEQGALLEPVIEFTGDQRPDQVLFSFKTDIESEYRERPMRDDQNGQFSAAAIELTSDIEYQVWMDGFSSGLYRVDVRIPPRFTELVAELIPPAYTALKRKEFRYPFSDLPFYKGSKITFSAKTNKAADLFLVYSTAGSRMVEPSDSLRSKFVFTAEPVDSDTLWFEMMGNGGIINPNPYRINLNLQEDLYPAVALLEPASDLVVNQPDQLEIRYRATDDFGISAARLNWSLERLFAEDAITGSRPLEVPENMSAATVSWDLNTLELRPRDTLTFWISVRDNDAVAGGKWGESQRIQLKVPSLTEYFEELGEDESQTADELDRVSDQFNEMQEAYDQYLEKMRENPDGGYEEQELLEGVSEKQKEMDASIEALKEQFQKLQEEMSESEMLSKETRKAYEELQSLMQEMNDPEFQEALDELRKAMEDMRPDEIERALEEVEFNEELYKERIERTKELFKELKMNSDLDKLARQYEEMADRIQKEASLEELMDEMTQLEEDMKSVEKQLDALTDQSPERQREELEALQEESKKALQEMMEELSEMQEKAAEEQASSEQAGMNEESGQNEQSDQNKQSEQSEQAGKSEQKDGSEASSPSEEPSESLKQDQKSLGEQMMMQAQNMQQMKGQMGGQQINVNLMALEHALLRLLDLSGEQERLTLQTNRTRDRSVGFVELAQRQNLIEKQFGAVADSIFKISSEVPGIPNTVNRKKAETERALQKSTAQLAERIQSGAVITSRESLSGINDLAGMIASLLEQLMNQSGGGSGGGSMSMEQMLEQMQQMSGDQQQLNRQMQQMVNDMQGNRLNQEQSDRLDQLARQQNEIRKQLQELKQSGALKEGDKLMSDLERMIEQMEDSINDLRGGMTDPLMMNRQQQILSRMLEAERAVQQRGEENKREGREAEDTNQLLPPEMTLEQLEQEIRSRLQDPDYTTYEEEIQRLIRRYFEMIRKSGGETLPP